MLKSIYTAIVSAIFVLALPAIAQAKEGTVRPLTTAAKSAEIVYVGFYPINVYGVDPATSTFTYDGYVWFRWKGGIDPTKTVEFTNSVERSSLTKQFLYDAPQVGPDGSKYQIMRIESKFMTPFSLASFPLDQHDLSIALEDSLYGPGELVYEIDKLDTGYAPNLSVSGWKLHGWSDNRKIVDYASTFGDRTVSQASQYARISFSMNISRPESYFVWKLLLPLVVVLCGAWIALVLNPTLTETRAALPASALLTTVFLQQGYTASLPETGGLVLLDKIYVVAYVLIVTTLCLVIVKSFKIEQMDEAQIQSLRKKDLVALAVQVIIFAASTIALVALR
ncbi:MAG: hypothetical protein ACKO0Z_01105 [Betaproteobacteria bacterium]